MAKDFGSRSKPHFSSDRKRANGVGINGMQSPDLVAGLDHPAWREVAAQSEQDAEVERQVGELVVDIEDIFALEDGGR